MVTIKTEPVDYDMILRSGTDYRFCLVESYKFYANCDYTGEFGEVCHTYDNFDDLLELAVCAEAVPWQILEKIAKFINTDEIEITQEQLEQLFVAADYMKMDVLLLRLRAYLLGYLAKEPFPDELHFSDVLMLVRLSDIVYRLEDRTRTTEFNQGKFIVGKMPLTLRISTDLYLAINFHKVITNKAVLKLNYKTLINIVKDNYLKCQEIRVLRLIKMWINHDSVNRRKYFEPLLRFVRYNAKDFQIDVFIKELSCFCTVPSCQCLTSTRYLLGICAKKAGAKEKKLYSFFEHPRINRKWKKV